MNLDDLQQRLDEARAACAVPGAALAVFDGGTGRTLVSGHASLTSGAAVLDHTRFQIGSITKVLTSALVATAADAGSLALDAPLTELLGDLATGPDHWIDAVTPRQLLTHTSGLPGDVFDDTGRGDDCVERYVRLIAERSPILPAGAFSYCNAGFVVAGRLLELVHARGYDELLVDGLAAPAGTTITTLPEQAILGSAAIGHQPVDDEGRAIDVGSWMLDRAPDRREPLALSDEARRLRATPVTTWMLPRSLSPCGSAVCASADDLLRLGLGLLPAVPDGVTPLATAAAREAMAQRLLDLPHTSDPEMRFHGLGWRHLLQGDVELLGHDGGSFGQCAFLRVSPEGWGFVLLTNSEVGVSLFEAIRDDVVEAVAGRRPRPVRQPDREAAAPATAAGVFRHADSVLRLRAEGASLVATLDEAPGLEIALAPEGPRLWSGSLLGVERAYLAFPADGSDGHPESAYFWDRLYLAEPAAA